MQRECYQTYDYMTDSPKCLCKYSALDYLTYYTGILIILIATMGAVKILSRNVNLRELICRYIAMGLQIRSPITFLPRTPAENEREEDNIIDGDNDNCPKPHSVVEIDTLGITPNITEIEQETAIPITGNEDVKACVCGPDADIKELPESKTSVKSPHKELQTEVDVKDLRNKNEPQRRSHIIIQPLDPIIKCDGAFRRFHYSGKIF